MTGMIVETEWIAVGSVVDVKAATHIIYSQDAKSRVPEEECNKHAKHVNVEVRILDICGKNFAMNWEWHFEELTNSWKESMKDNSWNDASIFI